MTTEHSRRRPGLVLAGRWFRRSLPAPVRAGAGHVWALALGTLRVCLRYRVTGLAAEAGFFALLSLPPLVLSLVASVGWVGSRLGTPTLLDLRARIRELSARVLTSAAVDDVILPTVDDVTSVARPGVVGIGIALALWSGSRVLNVYIDTISIMYGLGGRRGIVRTRVMSFSLYVAGLVVGAVALPLVLLGPSLIGRALPPRLDPLLLAYPPVVSLLLIVGLATLYHVSTPVRSPWRRDLPGAVLALVIWVLASWLLRWVIGASVGGTSIYGPLAAPIVVLIWLYFLAIAVLIGAALNAAVDERWPTGRREALAGDPEATQPFLATSADPGRPLGEADEADLDAREDRVRRSA